MMQAGDARVAQAREEAGQTGQNRCVWTCRSTAAGGYFLDMGELETKKEKTKTKAGRQKRGRCASCSMRRGQRQRWRLQSVASRVSSSQAQAQAGEGCGPAVEPWAAPCRRPRLSAVGFQKLCSFAAAARMRRPGTSRTICFWFHARDVSSARTRRQGGRRAGGLFAVSAE